MDDILPPTIEALLQFSHELDLVPVSPERLLHLRAVIRQSVVENEDGDFLHVDNRQFITVSGERRNVTQGDVNKLVRDILARLDPNYWLLDNEQKRQCDEILLARILSPVHTDPALEEERKVEAARTGRAYHPPVGEGLRAIDEQLAYFLEDAALRDTAAQRGKSQPGRPLQLLDANGNPRPEHDVVRDMTWGERKHYKKQKQHADERRAEIIQSAAQAAREKSREGIWEYNVSYPTRDYMFARYKKLSGSEIHLSWVTMKTADAREIKLIRDYSEVQMNEILAWGKLEALARMQLHNDLIRSRTEGRLPEVRASEADLISNPYLTEIKDVYDNSYLGFLRGVAEVMRTTAQSTDLDRSLAYAAMMAGCKRLNDLYDTVFVDNSIRETMPGWFVRQLIDMGRLQPRSAR
jgi:hypothetical protein